MIRLTRGLFFCWALPLLCQTNLLDQAGTAAESGQLAARISSLLPRRATASLEFQNLTRFPAADWSNFQSRLRDELGLLGVKTAGVETAGTPPENRIRVSLSEGSRGMVLVAEVSAGDGRQVAMLPFEVPASTQAKPPIALSQKPLWSQADPILDVLMEDPGPGMLVLDVHQVARYQTVEGKWSLNGVAALQLARPMPRDPRGRLEGTSTGFRAYLPAGTCDGTLQPEFKVTCSKETATWQSRAVHWVADRNVLEGDAAAPGFEGWGSDAVTLADPCGAGTVSMASSASNEHDSVRAYQIVNGQAAPMSDAMPLAGPVTALWPAESGREATLVVHNLQTGEYEASRLGVACNR